MPRAEYINSTVQSLIIIINVDLEYTYRPLTVFAATGTVTTRTDNIQSLRESLWQPAKYFLGAYKVPDN